MQKIAELSTTVMKFSLSVESSCYILISHQNAMCNGVREWNALRAERAEKERESFKILEWQTNSWLKYKNLEFVFEFRIIVQRLLNEFPSSYL